MYWTVENKVHGAKLCIRSVVNTRSKLIRYIVPVSFPIFCSVKCQPWTPMAISELLQILFVRISSRSFDHSRLMASFSLRQLRIWTVWHTMTNIIGDIILQVIWFHEWSEQNINDYCTARKAVHMCYWRFRHARMTRPTQSHLHKIDLYWGKSAHNLSATSPWKLGKVVASQERMMTSSLFRRNNDDVIMHSWVNVRTVRNCLLYCGCPLLRVSVTWGSTVVPWL